MTLVILAAGLGSRYGGSKQLDSIGTNGEIILDYSIYDAIRAGFNRILLLIKEENHNDFEEKAGKRFRGKIKIDYAFQDKVKYTNGVHMPECRVKPWGTGHALLCCKEQLYENFAVINADDFYGSEAYRLLSAHLSSCRPNEYCLIGYKLRNTLTDHGTVSRAVCGIRNGILETIDETKGIGVKNGEIFYEKDGSKHFLDKNITVSLSAYGFTPMFLQGLENGFAEFLAKADVAKDEYGLPDAVQNAVSRGEAIMRVYDSPDEWYGVTHREDREFVRSGIDKMINQKKYPNILF